MNPKISLGLRLLLEGKIVLLEGPGHPLVLEEMLGQWKARTMREIEVEREGMVRKLLTPGGSVYELSMLDLWAGGTFSEEKGEILTAASHATCLAISHLDFGVNQAYRNEAVQLLLRSRVDKIRKVSGSECRPCSIVGLDGTPGALRARYGDDLANLVGQAGLSIETP